MNNWNTIQKELQELNSSFLQHKAPEPYLVPNGYFEGFAASVLLKIKEEELSVSDELASLSPVLAGISRQMPFSVPDDYFSGLTQQMPELIKEDVLPGILLQAGKVNPYSVPENYFDGLSAQVLARVSRPQAKVVSFTTKKWMRLASAAIVAGIIALGGIFYLGNKTNSVETDVQSKNWVASQLNGVSNEDLDEFINSADVSLSETAMAQGGTTNQNAEVRKMLKDVSVSELDEFLNQVPTDKDELLIIN